MKKVLVFFLSMLFAVCLCACSPKSTANPVTIDGVSYVVDHENRTISDGTNIYQYTFSGNSSSHSIEITYPDGSTYWRGEQDNGGLSFGSGGKSKDYDKDRYVDGETLYDVLMIKTPPKTNSGNFLLGILVLAGGIFYTASPHTAWYLQYGWRYKDAEPSDLVLGLNRAGGVIGIIVGVVLFFV